MASGVRKPEGRPALAAPGSNPGEREDNNQPHAALRRWPAFGDGLDSQAYWLTPFELQVRYIKQQLASLEQQLLEKILDRSLANWRTQSWLQKMVELKKYGPHWEDSGLSRVLTSTVMTQRVCVYIKGRWVGGYDIRMTAVHDEVSLEGMELYEDPDSSSAGTGCAGGASRD